MRKRIYIYASLLFLLLTLVTGCIENDLDYPRIRVDITRFVTKGQLTVRIDTEERIVTVTLADTVNLKKVYLEDIQLTEGATGPLEAGMLLDLSSPQKYTFSLYQDYEWTIVAQQDIERIFKVEGQIGTEIINVDQKFASVQIGTATSLKDIKVTALKLGPTGSTVNMTSGIPALEWEQMSNYMQTTVMVNYSDFIVMEEWKLYVFQTDVTVSTSSVDAWTNVAWLYGEGLDGADNGFEIREASEEEWTRVDASYLTINGGAFSARVPHLKEQTTYICRAYSGADYGAEVSFTTEAAVSLPNGSFDDWHQSGKVWNPWAENGISYWDTGNKGATTAGGPSNTTPTDYVSMGNSTGKAAYLDSRYVSVFGVGKLAAGNLFFGEYVKTDGTNGILDFGRPFTARPTKLKGYYQYTSGIMDQTEGDYPELIGRPDSCHIYVAVGDWSEPVRIRTRPSERKLFEKDDPNIIAYGEFVSGTSTDAYKQFEVALEYRSTSRKPTYLVIVCTASKYGDYFVGSTGSELYLDEFTLEYDY